MDIYLWKDIFNIIDDYLIGNVRNLQELFLTYNDFKTVTHVEQKNLLCQ